MDMQQPEQDQLNESTGLHGTDNHRVIAKSQKQENLNEYSNNICNDNHLNWNHEDILRWIISLNNGLFVQYQHSLRQNLKDENMNGSKLKNVYKVDIKFWGITNMDHAQILHQEIQTLINIQ